MFRMGEKSVQAFALLRPSASQLLQDLTQPSPPAADRVVYRLMPQEPPHGEVKPA